jgi:integrase
MKTSLSLAQLYEEFLSRRASRLGNGSDYNRRNYEVRLRRFLELYGHMTAGDIQRGHVDAWLSEIAARGYQEATLSGYRQSLKALWNYAVSEAFVERSPAAHLKTGSFIPQRPKKPARAAVDKATAVALGMLQSDEPMELRDGLIFMLSRLCGPRRGEIRTLQRRHVITALADGPDEYGVYHVGTTGKTGKSLIHFDETVARAIRRWLSMRPVADTDALFVTLQGRPHLLSNAGMDRVYDRISAAAGLSRPIHSHALRHFVGDETTRCYGPKVAAMLLNHSDPDTAATAIAFYHHPGLDEVSVAVAGMVNHDDELAGMRRLFGLDPK